MSNRCPAIIGITPLQVPDARLAAALSRAGALGVLDLGRDQAAAERELGLLRRAGVPFGVRRPQGSAVAVPDDASWVIVEASEDLGAFGDHSLIVQVVDVAEAVAAVAAGASGLIAKGHEAGGRVGEESTFVLLQRVLDAVAVAVPVWAQGGIGLHSAAACFAAGAKGVVLDVQLARVAECRLPKPVRAAIASMDGSETRLIAGHRVYTRPDLPVAALGDLTAADVAARLGGADLHQDLVPAGQDGALAGPLGLRYRHADALITALLQAARGHLRQARALRPLDAHAPLAESLNIARPIAQGPMTRVSDCTAFAEAVASGGGLPFLALSLMRGPQVAALMRETAERLGDQTWGVGVLGFVPADLRAEQLKVIEEIRPPVALIAGGRPSQARELERLGITTFLHVPSPGLLDLFLKEGARSFVFEGRECGGHVGPRTSFVLWEQQVTRLLACPDVGDCSVFFAGGIHDARSAAMVAALAAPLAARGAKIGVLMGTAYLFTQEATASGAILPGFQEAAVACKRTVLLETAPGHATRCVESPYVRDFQETRERLELEGASAEAMWAELEQLNLGRLRIASKGVVRDGGGLRPVDAETQKAHGMFMIGQVAAIRDRVTTIEQLHAEVAEGSVAHLAAVDPDALPRPLAQPVDVAIVGMGAVFPGAGDVEEYWSNVVKGVNAVGEVPKERWDAAIYYDPEGSGEKTPSRWGGFLGDIPFDPLSYGIPPRSLVAIESVQLLALEIARRALEHAGYGAERDFERERVSVIFGAEAGTDLAGAYGFRSLWPQLVGELPEALDALLPRLTEDSFPGVLANVIAGRIANRLDLGGVNYTVDAACASSLAAIDLACKELTSRSSDMVLCGGADLHNSIQDYLMFASVHALSRTGQCRTFDASADGIVLGEGCAAVVLKRLDDAERDGDTIFGVIRGVAGSSDGKSLGLTAPRKDGQVRALDRAYRRAGISPADIGLVEAHGTGTVVGDRTEINTLTEVFTTAGALPQSCTLGSVKSQIGHTKCAAGLAGLIKVTLALHRGVRPPTLHVTRPNPAWEARRSPFQLSGESRPWESLEAAAGVSAFGFGGTNFHTIVERYPGERPQHAYRDWPSELVLLRGDDQAAALALAKTVLARLEGGTRARLADVALSIWSSGEGPAQGAIVATDLGDLTAKLRAWVAGDGGDDVYRRGSAAPGKVAFLFPGQGSQRPGMLADLFVAFPPLHEYLRMAPEYTAALFPPGAYDADALRQQKKAITDTRVAQPALGITGLAMAELLAAVGLSAEMMGGHSYGELVALCVAGAFSPETLLGLSRARATSILDSAGADPGTMAAVKAGPADIALHLEGLGDVVMANHNAPKQLVISGPTSAVGEAVARLDVAGVKARELSVACAFHSPVLDGADQRFLAALDLADIEAPTGIVYSNTTAEPYPESAAGVRGRLAAHLLAPVRWVEQIEAMYAAGARTFVEVGSGAVLSRLVGKILGDREHVAVATDVAGEPGVPTLLSALAQLAARGLPVDPSMLYDGRAVAYALDELPSADLPATTWLVNGMRARPARGAAPPGGLQPAPAPLGLTLGGLAAPTDGREAAVVEFLRTSREMVEAQRQVMLSYLGEVPAPRAVAASRGGSQKTLAAKAETAPAIIDVEPAAEDPHEVLLGIVSERTGYPLEMLDLDLDLEADLSIDSIKRIEILGELGERIGLGAVDDDERDAMIEDLAALKTLRGILDWLANRSDEDDGAGETAAAVSGPALKRFVLRGVNAPAMEAREGAVAGRQVAVVGGSESLAAAVQERLTAVGAALADGTPEGIVDLSALDDGEHDVVAAFERIKAVLTSGGRWVVAATRQGSGLAGFLKSASWEYPDARIRAVDLPEGVNGDVAVAETLVAELVATNGPVQVGWQSGGREMLEAVEEALDATDVDALALDDGAVVLVTGGARGITADASLALAKRYRCHLILVGRTPLDELAPDIELDGCADLAAIRRLIIGRGVAGKPAEIDRLARRLLGQREVRQTLAAIEAEGGKATYHALDVRDSDAFAALIDGIYAEHGRLDGVIHAAGVIEDRRLVDKTPESFARVYETKVAPARVLARMLRDEVRFVVFFASVSGAFGNKGQADYAAANAALDELAHSLDARLAGRVVSIDWGPWGGKGMVDPALAREYERRGIGLIDPVEGVAALLAELDAGTASQVVLAADGLDAFRS